MERLTWVKSSLSFSNGNCVEVAHLPGGHIGLRDSKNPAGPVLRFTTDEWNAFLGGARNGEFDGFGKELSLTARRRSVLSWLAACVIPGEGPRVLRAFALRAPGQARASPAITTRW